MSIGVGDIVRLVIEYGLPAASAALNVFYFKPSGTITDEDATDDFYDFVYNTWGADWATLAHTAAEILTFAVDVVDTEGHVLSNVGSGLVGLSGLASTDAQSAAVSAYLKAETAVPKTRGSKYVPGMHEGSVDAGYVNGTALGYLSSLLNTYMNAFTGATSFKSYQPGVPSRPLAVWVPFTGSGTLTDVPAYQRRRKPNVGS